MTSLLIHLHGEGFERAYQALTLALTARALGQEVAVVVAFGALRALAEDRLGEPVPGPDLWASKRAEQLGVAPISRMLADAKTLKVSFLACETVCKLAGVEPEQLEGKAELTGLPRIARLQQQAQVLYL
jgi:peroxiredoxin family protein